MRNWIPNLRANSWYKVINISDINNIYWFKMLASGYLVDGHDIPSLIVKDKDVNAKIEMFDSENYDEESGLLYNSNYMIMINSKIEDPNQVFNLYYKRIYVDLSKDQVNQKPDNIIDTSMNEMSPEDELEISRNEILKNILSNK